MPASKLLSSVLNTSELSKPNDPILSPTLPPSPIQTTSTNVIRIQMALPEDENREDEEIDDGLPRSIPTTPKLVYQQQTLRLADKEEIHLPAVKHMHIQRKEKEVSSKTTDPILKAIEKKRNLVEKKQTNRAKESKIEQMSQISISSTSLYPLREDIELDSPTPAALDMDSYDLSYSDFKMRRSFAKASLYHRLKQRVKYTFARLFGQRHRAHKSNHSRRMRSDEHIPSELKELTPNTSRYLSRSISAIAIAGKDSDIEEDEDESEEEEEQEVEKVQPKKLEGPPIYCRNIATSILYNLSKTEPVAGHYSSPQVGSGDAYNIKVLCEQSFFGTS
ncbi:hypothetical protein BD560DRAFT_485686 [Blakeslea trispora]|nr:hypothetical protein BD560DRAFT_485686 [Blakeslea trispora]